MHKNFKKFGLTGGRNSQVVSFSWLISKSSDFWIYPLIPNSHSIRAGVANLLIPCATFFLPLIQMRHKKIRFLSVF